MKAEPAYSRVDSGSDPPDARVVDKLTSRLDPYLLQKIQSAEFCASRQAPGKSNNTPSSNQIPLTPEDIPRLRDQWIAEYSDLLGPIPLQLPPLREVNHTIPLIDENKRYNYHMPRCPEALQPELMEKIDRYTTAGWWRYEAVSDAAPLLCVPKKAGTLRSVVDARQRNENTHKDVTPFPDQDQIRMDCARAERRSKIDMSDAYEQIRNVPGDVWKTAFATITGTFVSEVMQQGDCNAPSTFQRLMTWIYRKYIGKFIRCYLDDIFVYSDSIEDHELRSKFFARTSCTLAVKSWTCTLLVWSV